MLRSVRGTIADLKTQIACPPRKAPDESGNEQGML
jgi:hypothetical protein